MTSSCPIITFLSSLLTSSAELCIFSTVDFSTDSVDIGLIGDGKYFVRILIPSILISSYGSESKSIPTIKTIIYDEFSCWEFMLIDGITSMRNIDYPISYYALDLRFFLRLFLRRRSDSV